MSRATSPSFVVELPLRVSPQAEREALIRLELARQLSNATLAEGLKRLERYRASLAYKRACALRRGSQRTQAFKAARRECGFTSAQLSAFATHTKNAAKWNEGRPRTDPRLGAHETQRVAERVFAAIEQYSFGRRGRPRFKGKHRPLHSLEGKSTESGLCWKEGALQWGALTLAARRPPAGKDRWFEEALKCRTKYARVIWRLIKGRRRWFVQLVQQGRAPRKYESTLGAVVGLDVGPSNIAVFSDEAAALVRLCPEVKQPWARARVLQRAMDRSRRATNPDCFRQDGTYKPGSKIAVRSRHYRQLRAALRETERVLAARRKRSHGALANRIVALGNVIRTETLSHTSFQRNFGRSVKVRAAGSLMSLIRRKAERAGGGVVELNTRALKLSQYDHCTHTFSKKALSERWHRLGDGSGYVQRDLYSAFLAAQVRSNTLPPSQVDTAWPGAKSLLDKAGGMRAQPVSETSVLVSAQALPAPEPVALQRITACGDVAPTSRVVRRGAGVQ